MKRKVKNVTKRMGYLFMALIMLMGNIPAGTVYATESDVYENSTESGEKGEEKEGSDEGNKIENSSEDSNEVNDSSSESSEGDNTKGTEENTEGTTSEGTEESTEETLSEGTEESTEETESEDTTETETEEVTETETETEEAVQYIPEEYILSGSEQFSASVVSDSVVTCQQDGKYCRKAVVEISMQGFNDIAENEGKTLSATISVSPSENVVSVTDQLSFSNVESTKTLDLVVDKAGSYTININVYGVTEQDGDYVSKEDTYSSDISISKQDVSFKKSQDQISIKYGETLDVETYIEDNLLDEGEIYPGELMYSIENGDTYFSKNGNHIRAIGIPEAGDEPKLKIWYEESDISKSSEVVEIPLTVGQVMPEVMMNVSFNQDDAGKNIAYIHESYNIEMKVQPSQEEAAYFDLLNQDELKAKYTITNVETKESETVEKPLSISETKDCAFLEESIEVDSKLFKNMRSDKKYNITVELVIDDAVRKAYDISEDKLHSSYDVTLKSADAHVQLSRDIIDDLSYRKAKDTVVNLGISLKHDAIFGIQKKLDPEELEEITYKVSSLDPKVAYIDESVTYSAAQLSELPVTIAGVGETTITINAVGSSVYNIQGASVKVKVSDSPLENNDLLVKYNSKDGEKTYNYKEWQEFLNKHDNWITDSFTVAINDEILDYYDSLCYSIDDGGTKVGKNGEFVLDKEQPDFVEPVTYNFWLQNKSTNASTKEADNGTCVLSVKKDTGLPVGSDFEDNREERFQTIDDNGVTTWYFGDKFELKGTYKDTSSGVKCIQYSVDGGKNWNNINENINKETVTDKAGNSIIQWNFALTLKDGTYSGIAVRAVDTAGNISKEYKLTDKNNFVKVVIDSAKPACNITVRTDNRILNDSELEKWTNKALTYTYEASDDIYEAYYMYVPVGKTVDTEQPYLNGNWLPLSKDGLTVGNSNKAVNKNGVYYFKTVSAFGVESDVQSKTIMLQQEIPDKMELTIKNNRKGAWYNKKTGVPEVEFPYEDYMPGRVTSGTEYKAPITICRELSVSGVDNSGVKLPLGVKKTTIGFTAKEQYIQYRENQQGHTQEDYQAKMDELKVSFEDGNVIYDGMYTLRYWIEDAAGNKSDISTYKFNIDTQAPDNISVILDGKTLKNADNGTIIYDTFSNNAVSGTATAEDILSGIESVKILKAKTIGEWEDAAKLEDGSNFTISPCTRCFLYVLAKDKAGNENYILTNGIIVDNKNPVGKYSGKMILEPEGANENGFYNGDVTIKVAVKDAPDYDNYSSLKEIKCIIGKDENNEEEINLFKSEQNELTGAELKQQKNFETEIVIDAARYESNNAFLNVTASDYAGNTGLSSQIVKIDITKPIVNIDFDNYNAQNGSYYNEDRKATIHVTELNFDPEDVQVHITRNGATYKPGALVWETSGIEHYAEIVFSKDGDYTLSVDCKDMADNKADEVSVEPFTIDKELPSGKSFSDNEDECFRKSVNDGIATWYFGKPFVIKGTFKDEVSNVYVLEYSTDGGNNWSRVNDEDISIGTVKNSAGKTVNQWKFAITFEDGEYQGIAVRAIDMAGNISAEHRITDEQGNYAHVSINSSKPDCMITVQTDSKVLDDSELANWTRESLKYTYADTGNIYKVYYQYVPVGKVLSAEKNSKKPYSDDKWTLMSEKGFTVGDLANPVNKNGVYYFKAISNHGICSDIQAKVIMLQQSISEKMPVIIENDMKEAWYNAETGTPEITFQFKDYLSGCVEKEQEYEAPITIHRVLTVEGVSKSIIDILQSEQTAMIGFGSWENYNEYLNGSGGYSEQDYQEKIKALNVSFVYDNVIYDGIYTLKYWIEDAAGNKSEESTYHFNIDTGKPVNIEAFLNGDKLQQTDNGTITYNIFKKNSVSGKATAEDELSGIESVKILKAKSVTDWKNASGLEDGNDFTISPCTRCFLYVIAQDKAGNTDYITTEGIIVDDQKPVGKEAAELVLEPQGANKNGFFNDDVKVKVSVKDAPDTDDYSSLKEIKCTLGKDEKEIETRSLFNSTKQSLSESDLKQQKEYTEEVVLDAEKYESNFAYLEVTAQDYSENSNTSSQEIKIDITKPQIKVDFDNNNVQNGSYYNSDRRATIHITELNFDPNEVKVEVTKDGNVYETGSLVWTTEENEHYATILFSIDGDYTLSVNCTDMADNEADEVTVEPFTIDKTEPVVEVTYDNNSPHKDNYYNESRVATITVTEHNFRQEDFKLEAVPQVALGNWTHNGDTHQAKINFTEDGHYTFTCKYADLAGNSMKEMEPQEFYIDKVAPVITISGVEDGSANAGEVVPVITVNEDNYNQEEINISVETGLGTNVTVAKAAKPIENGFSYTLTDMTTKEDNVYYLTVSATDLAGNNAELVYSFSLNRHGSTYDLSGISGLTQKTYYKSSDIPDMKIVEMNVDKVEKFSVYVSRNGNVLPSKQVKLRAFTDNDEICYKVETQGSERTGYRYEYTIFKENFEQEGVYNISFYSKDEAGNEVNNTLDEKGAEVRFVIDNTAPKVIIDGIEAGEVYAAESQTVNVMVTDNFMLNEAEFYLVNEDGDELKRWDYFELVDEEGTMTQLTIPEYNGKQSLLFRAVDAAGNEIVTLPDSEETPKGFIVSTNPLAQIAGTPGKSETKRIIMLLTIFAAIAAGISIMRFVKKKSNKK